MSCVGSENCSCEDDSNCDDDLHCDTNDNLCYVCTENSHCDLGSVCQDNQCALCDAEDCPCETNDQCSSPLTCIDSTCQEAQMMSNKNMNNTTLTQTISTSVTLKRLVDSNITYQVRAEIYKNNDWEPREINNLDYTMNTEQLTFDIYVTRGDIDDPNTKVRYSIKCGLGQDSDSLIEESSNLLVIETGELGQPITP